MIKFNKLYRIDQPWVFIDIVSAEEATWTPLAFYSNGEFRPVIRMLRGNKMRTRKSLMDEFGAALQFYGDFGENWYGLKEYLCYMDEWLPADSYILVVTNPREVLVEEDEEEFVWLLQTFREVGEWWSKPVTDNHPFNRSAIPFHAVFRFEGDTPAVSDPRFGDIPVVRRIQGSNK